MLVFVTMVHLFFVHAAAQVREMDPKLFSYSRPVQLTAWKKAPSSTQIVVDPNSFTETYILPTGFKTAIDHKNGEIALSVYYEEKKLTRAQSDAILQALSKQISEQINAYAKASNNTLSLKIINASEVSEFKGPPSVNVKPGSISPQDKKEGNYLILNQQVNILLPTKVSSKIETGPLNGLIHSDEHSEYFFEHGKAINYQQSGSGSRSPMWAEFYCTFHFDEKTEQFFIKKDQDILYRTRDLNKLFSLFVVIEPRFCIEKTPVQSCEIHPVQDQYYNDRKLYLYTLEINGMTIDKTLFNHPDEAFEWAAAHIPDLLQSKKCKFPEEEVLKKISRQVSNFSLRSMGLGLFCEQSPQEKIDVKLKNKK